MNTKMNKAICEWVTRESQESIAEIRIIKQKTENRE